jgi:hypothetical protein
MQVPFQLVLLREAMPIKQGWAGVFEAYAGKKEYPAESRRACIVPYRDGLDCGVCNSIPKQVWEFAIIFLLNINRWLNFYFDAGTAVATDQSHPKCFTEDANSKKSFKLFSGGDIAVAGLSG